MKKLFYIVAGLAFFFVLALIGVTLWIFTKSEFEKNSARTSKAREARWQKKDLKPADLEGKSEDEVNKILDQLNENKNEKEGENNI